MSLRDRAEVTERGFFSEDGSRWTVVDGRRSAAPSEPQSPLSHLRIFISCEANVKKIIL
jgi:hypothetical protein